MALQKNYNFTIEFNNFNINEKLMKKIGVENSIKQSKEIKDAYYKIDNIEGGKEKLTIFVNIYIDNSKEIFLGSKSYTFIPSVEDNALNFIKQGYEYLKTLEEYKNAIDLLDEGQTI